MRNDFDAETIDAFLHHCHFIPASKGLLRTWMETNAPGWTPEGLLTALSDAGAVVRVEGYWERPDSVDHVTLSHSPLDPRSTP